MTVQVKIPQLGKSLQKPVLVEWKVKEGDWVEQGGSVLVIETEKIRNDIEAEASGYVHILVEEGNETGVSSVVAYITETKEELAALQKEKPAVALAAVVEPEEAPPAEAEVLFNQFVDLILASGLRVETGRFQQHMLVEIHNEGPVTIFLDSGMRARG